MAAVAFPGLTAAFPFYLSLITVLHALAGCSLRRGMRGLTTPHNRTFKEQINYFLLFLNYLSV
jgi:hypothetical protein